MENFGDGFLSDCNKIRNRCADLQEKYRESQAENERLRRVAKVAADIYRVADTKCVCPHGDSGRYPSHAWWCDDCFGELGAALDALKGCDE